jgi:hypothetical protein
MTPWDGLLATVFGTAVSIVINSYIYGKRAGNQEKAVETLEKEMGDACRDRDWLRAELVKVRSAFEAYTGYSVEGDNFRPRRRGEHD